MGGYQILSMFPQPCCSGQKMGQHRSLPLSSCMYQEDGQGLPMLPSTDYKYLIMGLGADQLPGAIAITPNPS